MGASQPRKASGVAVAAAGRPSGGGDRTVEAAARPASGQPASPARQLAVVPPGLAGPPELDGPEVPMFGQGWVGVVVDAPPDDEDEVDEVDEVTVVVPLVAALATA